MSNGIHGLTRLLMRPMPTFLSVKRKRAYFFLGTASKDVVTTNLDVENVYIDLLNCYWNHFPLNLWAACLLHTVHVKNCTVLAGNGFPMRCCQNCPTTLKNICPTSLFFIKLHLNKFVEANYFYKLR